MPAASRARVDLDPSPHGHGVATHAPLTEDELKLILADSHKGGIVTDGEAEVILRAFEFADKQAEEVMIPAEKVSYISLERSLEQNLDAARAHMHARLPVCRTGLDSVVGTVSMKDVWPLLEHEHSNAAFEHACRHPIIIPIDFSQEDILKALRAARGQIGIVRDRAHGKTLGIVTLEDVLESLVGDFGKQSPPGLSIKGASRAMSIRNRPPIAKRGLKFVHVSPLQRSGVPYLSLQDTLFGDKHEYSYGHPWYLHSGLRDVWVQSWHTLAGTDLRIGIIATNTMLAFAAGAVMAMIYMWLKVGKPDPTMMAMGCSPDWWRSQLPVPLSTVPRRSSLAWSPECWS